MDWKDAAQFGSRDKKVASGGERREEKGSGVEPGGGSWVRNSREGSPDVIERMTTWLSCRQKPKETGFFSFPFFLCLIFFLLLSILSFLFFLFLSFFTFFFLSRQHPIM